MKTIINLGVLLIITFSYAQKIQENKSIIGSNKNVEVDPARLERINEILNKSLGEDISKPRFIKYKDITNSVQLDSSITICYIPKTLNDLNDGYDIFYSNKSYKIDASGHVFYVKAGTRNSQKQLNYKFLQFKKSSCEIKNTVKELVYGCGVELELTVMSSNSSLDVTSLPMIAAAVTYDDAKVTYKIKIIGITGNVIRKSLARSGNFDVENYGKIMSAIDAVIDNMDKSDVFINPQIIAMNN